MGHPTKVVRCPFSFLRQVVFQLFRGEEVGKFALLGWIPQSSDEDNRQSCLTLSHEERTGRGDLVGEGNVDIPLLAIEIGFVDCSFENSGHSGHADCESDRTSPVLDAK